MTKYRLLKDLPNLKAGAIFVLTEIDIGCWYQCNEKLNYKFVVSEIEGNSNWFEKIEDKKKGKLWKPRKYEAYYTLEVDAAIPYCWYDDKFDNKFYDFGIVFRSVQEREFWGKKFLAYRELVQHVADCNEGKEWGRNVYNKDVGFCIIQNSLGVCVIKDVYNGSWMYYKDEKDAQQSLIDKKSKWKTFYGIERSEG